MNVMETIIKGALLLFGAGCILGGGFCVAFPLWQPKGWGGLEGVLMFSGIGSLFVLAGFLIVRATQRWGVRTPGAVMDFEKPHMREPPRE
jgi:hypothetical protein